MPTTLKTVSIDDNKEYKQGYEGKRIMPGIRHIPPYTQIERIVFIDHFITLIYPINRQVQIKWWFLLFYRASKELVSEP